MKYGTLFQHMQRLKDNPALRDAYVKQNEKAASDRVQRYSCSCDVIDDPHDVWLETVCVVKA